MLFLLVGIALRPVLIARANRNKSEKHSIIEVLRGEVWLYAIAVLVVGFALPRVELADANQNPVGMAVRGYGVMLLTGVASAIGLAAYRARKRGIDPDLIYSMAPWAFIGGISGARVFYVMQYRDQFFADSLGQTLSRIFNFTQGGLVVYGSFIGGGLAVLFFLVRHRLSPLKFGDVIVPCMFLGVFFGRMGCLMNGCCYGGRCEPGPMAVRFPPQAKVYSDQIESGELLGLNLGVDEESNQVLRVSDGSIAERKGVEVGDHLLEMMADYSSIQPPTKGIPLEDLVAGLAIDLRKPSGERYRIRIPASEMPPKALPVRAAQIISSLASLALCLALCFLSRWNLRTGTIMLIGFAAYAVLRFVLEIVRVDEQGQFGTSFSISQWVSICVLSGAAIGMILLYRWTSDLTSSPAHSTNTTG